MDITTTPTATGGCLPNQPADSMALIESIIEELAKLTKSDDDEVFNKLDEAADKIMEQFKKMAQQPKPSDLHKFSCTYELPAEIFSSETQKLNSTIRQSLKLFLFTNYQSRKHLATVISTYLSLFPFKEAENTLETDETGYYISNLAMFSELMDKIVDGNVNATKEIQSAYLAIISNGNYTPEFRKKLQHLASLYLLRHHTLCLGCKSTELAGKSLLQGAPLCIKCLKNEEDALKGFIASDIPSQVGKK